MNVKSKKALAMMVVSGGLAAAVATVTPTVAQCKRLWRREKGQRLQCLRRGKSLWRVWRLCCREGLRCLRRLWHSQNRVVGARFAGGCRLPASTPCLICCPAARFDIVARIS